MFNSVMPQFGVLPTNYPDPDKADLLISLMFITQKKISISKKLGLEQY